MRDAFRRTFLPIKCNFFESVNPKKITCMKAPKFYFLVLAFCLAVVSFAQAVEIADSSIQVSYIGSTGYLLETTNHRVLIDPAYGDIVQGFGYPYASSEVEAKLLNAEEPFDAIDLILISHVHLGHFDPDKTIKCLEANTGAILVGTQAVIDALEIASTDFNLIKDRVYVPQIESYTMFDTVITSIPLTTTKIEHWGQTELQQYKFKMDSVTVAYYLDYNKRSEEDHHVQTTGINLGILDGGLFSNSTNREMFKTDFEVGYSILTHFTDLDGMQATIDENTNEFSNIDFIPWSMEILNVNFKAGNVEMEEINLAPYFTETFKTDSILVGEAFSLNFSDAYGDDVGVEGLKIKLSNGNDVPDWINADEDNAIVSGTASEAQRVVLALELTDSCGAWSSATKRIEFFEKASGINELSETDIKVYPTTVSESLFIEKADNNKFIDVQIIDITGKSVMHQQLQSATSVIDMSLIPAGMYIVYLSTQNALNTIPIIVK